MCKFHLGLRIRYIIQEQLNIWKLWHVVSRPLRRKTSKSSTNMTAKTDMHMYVRAQREC